MLDSPEWFVTNSQKTVGPVTTNLLLRGVAAERIDLDCQVCRAPWSTWRPLESIREVRTLQKTQALLGQSWVPNTWWSPGATSAPSRASVARVMEDACDDQEVLGLTLQGLATEMHASVGMLHQPTRALGALTTRGLVGRADLGRLGDEVRASDPAMRMARMGVMVLAQPSDSRAGIASVHRLGEACEGVALAPIFRGPKLMAIVELGREERPFRDSDRSIIKSFTRCATLACASGWPVVYLANCFADWSSFPLPANWIAGEGKSFHDGNPGLFCATLACALSCLPTAFLLTILPNRDIVEAKGCVVLF
jgi:hypothetical protein